MQNPNPCRLEGHRDYDVQGITQKRDAKFVDRLPLIDLGQSAPLVVRMIFGLVERLHIGDTEIKRAPKSNGSRDGYPLYNFVNSIPRSLHFCMPPSEKLLAVLKMKFSLSQFLLLTVYAQTARLNLSIMVRPDELCSHGRV